MKKYKQILLGVIITIVIYLISKLLASIIDLKIDYIAQASMLLLSIIMIYFFKNQLDFKLKIPEFKNVIFPFLVGFIVSIVSGLLYSIISKTIGFKLEKNPLRSIINPFQFFVLVFILASISEELLFRGFLLNYLNNYIKKSFLVFKWKIKLSVLISGVMFGLAHLVLAKHNVSVNFLVSIVISATAIGVIAGLFQEKYKNTMYAIIAHMGANFIGLLALLFTNHI